MTGAAVRRSTPWQTATLPSSRISAPMRCSSCTCMKRFSKTVSVTMPTPSAMLFRAQNWACMSVGKAGWGAVWMSTARGRRPCMSSSIQSAPTSIWAPASRSFCSTASRQSGRVSRPAPARR